MKYRKFGSLDWQSSILAFGTAGLPSRRSHPGSPDEDLSAELIRGAIDLGVNYLDLGYPREMRHQERIARAVGRSLQGGYRERVKIAVTLPTHLADPVKHFDAQLDTQLRWLEADRADFCVFGRLNRENWPILQNSSALEWAEAAIRSSRVEHFGFAFHDHFQPLKSVLSAWGQWAFCQFQFSYMDIDHDPGISGIRHAAELGLAVVVSDPLKSGLLTRNIPEPVSRVWTEALKRRSLMEWGLRFVWNDAQISAAILDIPSRQELAESAACAERAEPGGLSVQEEVWIGKMRDARRSLQRIPCKSCRPCMPCPEGIDVPRIFEIYNDAFIYQDLETARAIYRREMGQAHRCTRCGCCENRCVKRLPMMKLLEAALRLLEEPQ